MRCLIIPFCNKWKSLTKTWVKRVPHPEKYIQIFMSLLCSFIIKKVGAWKIILSLNLYIKLIIKRNLSINIFFMRLCFPVICFVFEDRWKFFSKKNKSILKPRFNGWNIRIQIDCCEFDNAKLIFVHSHFVNTRYIFVLTRRSTIYIVMCVNPKRDFVGWLSLCPK